MCEYIFITCTKVNVNGFIGRLHLPTLAENQNDFTWDDYSLLSVAMFISISAEENLTEVSVIGTWSTFLAVKTSGICS